MPTSEIEDCTTTRQGSAPLTYSCGPDPRIPHFHECLGHLFVAVALINWRSNHGSTVQLGTVLPRKFCFDRSQMIATYKRYRVHPIIITRMEIVRQTSVRANGCRHSSHALER